MKIGIILGSTREGRVGEQVAQWVAALANQRDSAASYELIDLLHYDLPFFTGAVPPRAAKKQYDDARVAKWSEKIDSFGGFVFVTPEYNQCPPAPFKNAFDTLGEEWSDKGIALVGYGYHGGLNSMETWRQIVSGFTKNVAEKQVSFNLGKELKDGKFIPAQGQESSVHEVLDELEALLK